MRWPIGKNGRRDSKGSMPSARFDDGDDNDFYTCMSRTSSIKLPKR